jgi:uncharacterized protein YndB with AHSA1/START domain
MSRTDTAIRIISAPPDRVYAALTDPDALAVWLPPDGMTGRFEHFDARPGGSYRLVLTYADASAARGKSAADSDVVDARFVEIVPGVRVVQQIEFVSENPAFHGTCRLRRLLLPHGNSRLVRRGRRLIRLSSGARMVRGRWLDQRKRIPMDSVPSVVGLPASHPVRDERSRRKEPPWRQQPNRPRTSRSTIFERSSRAS